MTRIRYKRLENMDNVILESTQNFLATNEFLKVTLYVKELEGYISVVNENRYKQKTSFKADTLMALKKEAKELLKSYGVVFSDEVRVRFDHNNTEYTKEQFVTEDILAKDLEYAKR